MFWLALYFLKSGHDFDLDTLAAIAESISGDDPDPTYGHHHGNDDENVSNVTSSTFEAFPDVSETFNDDHTEQENGSEEETRFILVGKLLEITGCEYDQARALLEVNL